MTDRTRFGHRAPTALVTEPKVRDGVATIRLDSAIDSYGGIWGISAQEFTAALDSLPDDTQTIELRVASPGGEIFEAVAIASALRSHPARVVAVVDALAASAASYIIATCDEVVMMRGAMVFVHDAQGFAMGNAATMRAMAADLDKFSDVIASAYAERTDMDPAEWRALMAAETWFTAEEAVEVGLADRVDAAPADEAKKATALAALRSFTARAERPTTEPPSASAAGSASPTDPTGDTTQKEVAMAFTPEQLDHMRAAVGVPQDADEATIVAAIDEALAERAVEPAPATNALPEGMALMDEATLAQLRADADAGRKAREEQIRAHREETVTAAIKDGRIPPARKDAWLAMLATDPGAEESLAQLAPGTIPVTEIGHAAEGEVIKQADAYTALYAPKEA